MAMSKSDAAKHVHDLRKPMNSISMQAELVKMLSEGQDNAEEIEQALDKIILSAKACSDGLQVFYQEIEAAVEKRTQELSLYSQELQRSNRELEDFAFVASHDLQEPLRKIRAFGGRLEDHSADKLDEKAHDYLRRMLNAAERMSKLISDLLDFSRVHTQGRAFEEVDLSEVLDNAIEDLSEAINDAKTEVKIDKLPMVTADQMQMRQLFYNLLNNAVKFSATSENPEVRVYVERVDKPVELQDTPFESFHKITICDNGIGFSQEHEEKIFAPFQRLHGKKEYKGTGIGLSICRRIIERHNGTIEVKSAENAGASFIVYLPEKNLELSLSEQGDE